MTTAADSQVLAAGHPFRGLLVAETAGLRLRAGSRRSMFDHDVWDLTGLTQQWHSTEDYLSSISCYDNRFHGPFYTRFIEYNGSRPADTEVRRTAARDRTNLHCPCFNVGDTFDSPSLRAAAVLHESWHHWQYEHGFDPSHPLCDNGSECDWYYFHGVGRFDFGVMNTWDTNPQHFAFHSPYQVMVEFLGDLSELSTADTPAVVRQMARTAGNSVLIQKFKNPVRYRIGDPRPW